MSDFSANQVNIIKEEFSKKGEGLPIYESSVIKIGSDFEKMEPSSFNENFDFPDGFADVRKVSSISFSSENVLELRKSLIEPKCGFGYFTFSRFQKVMFIKCENSEETGYLRIKSGKELSLEPIFIEVPQKTKCSLFIHFDLSEGEAAFDLIRTKVDDSGSLSLYLLFDNYKGKRFVDFSSHLGKESQLRVFPVCLEGESFLFRSNHNLIEEKSSYTEKLLTVIKNKEKGDFKTIVNEEREGVKVDVEARGVIKDYARAAISGLLKVKKEAVKSSSLYSAHCLKLSQNSKVDIEPNLEIEALDVTASHSASVSPVDEEKLFYLESRGLDKEKAKKEISAGFLFSLIGDNPFIEEKIEEIL